MGCWPLGGMSGWPVHARECVCIPPLTLVSRYRVGASNTTSVIQALVSPQALCQCYRCWERTLPPLTLASWHHMGASIARALCGHLWPRLHCTCNLGPLCVSAHSPVHAYMHAHVMALHPSPPAPGRQPRKVGDPCSRMSQ